ncbi:hypothetical protein H4R34_004189 [Dimargaris verticillata]|uniref:C2 domain-containing protein n=1 Tax=Dimargaris verticillata TaxID=2761393 RepID=A0A9W8B5F6_9FUNG|nr:hypothetical protein H4R34_004189 [Dimargaris verticillata]
MPRPEPTNDALVDWDALQAVLDDCSTGADTDGETLDDEALLCDPALLAELALLAEPNATPPIATEPYSPPLQSPSPAQSEGRLSPSPSPEPSPHHVVTVEALEQCLREYKAAAVAHKRQGALPKARQLLAVAKQLEAHYQNLTNGGTLPHDFTLPDAPPVPSPVKSTPLPTPAAVPLPSRDRASPSPTPPLDTSTLALAKHLRTQLDEQRQRCTAIASYYHRRGHTDQALQFHRYKKAFIRDMAALDTLASGPSLENAPTILYHYETVDFEVEAANHDVPLPELHLEIVRIGGLEGLQHSAWVAPPSALDLYVSWDVSVPTAGSVSTTTVKGTSKVVKRTCEPQFAHTLVLPAGRRHRPFLRWLERKRLELQVYHYKGLLWGSTWLGKVLVPLQLLLDQCEVHDSFPLVDKNRRPLTTVTNTVPFMEIKLRARVPFHEHKAISRQSERWVMVDRLAASDASPQLTENLPAPSPVPPASPSPLPPPPMHPEQLEQLQAVDLLVSNAVLEYELTVCQQLKALINVLPASSVAWSQLLQHTTPRIQTLIHRLDPSQLPALQCLVDEAHALSTADLVTERRQAIELRVQLLETQVAVGSLTLDAYLAQVKQDIQRHKTLAVALKRAGHQTAAQWALIRIKLMDAEVKEVTDAMG